MAGVRLDVSGEGASLPRVVVPGPELRSRVDNFAARLSSLEKRKADEMVAKVLASGKRNQFLFVDASHIFYPYFLSRLSEYRSHPELRPDKPTGSVDDKRGGHGVATSTDKDVVAATTVRSGTMLQKSGGTMNTASEELLRRVEHEAQQWLRDPYPHIYSLDLRGGTVDMSALAMDVMTCTAQFAAKYGDHFVHGLVAKHRHNALFRFLHTDDVRFEVYSSLVKAYMRILGERDAATEARLEALTSRSRVLEVVCGAKVRYAKAALARRKAALLTDDELRVRLQWSAFKVVHTFTLSDLSLDEPLADATAAPTMTAMRTDSATLQHPIDTFATRKPVANTLLPPNGMPVYVPTYMSTNLVHASNTTTDDDTAHAGSKRRRGSAS